MPIIVSPLLTIPAWCALWGPLANCACVLSNSQSQTDTKPSCFLFMRSPLQPNITLPHFTSPLCELFKQLAIFLATFSPTISSFLMGLLWNFLLQLAFCPIFLQNAWVHISGWVYRGDFGGLQLSHHLFLLHQNDKLPKFRQQHRGGMRLCLLSSVWQLYSTMNEMKVFWTAQHQEQVSGVFVKAFYPV